MQSFGAELVLSDPKKGCIGAYEKALEVLARTPNSYMLNQVCTVLLNRLSPIMHGFIAF